MPVSGSDSYALLFLFHYSRQPAMPASLSVVTLVQSKPVFTVFNVHYKELLKFEELLVLKSVTVVS